MDGRVVTESVFHQSLIKLSDSTSVGFQEINYYYTYFCTTIIDNNTLICQTQISTITYYIKNVKQVLNE